MSGSTAAAGFSSIRDVLDLMAANLAACEERGDHRAVFQRVYLLMTREMERRLVGGFFDDLVWMERVLVGFATYYFRAIDRFDRGGDSAPAWSLALEAAARRNALVLEDALLGINAHINNDLPFVLADVLMADQAWPDARLMLRRRRDHDRINQILLYLVDSVQDELVAHYARLLRPIDRWMGRGDESLSGFILAHCRTNVWHYTELLLDAPDQAERQKVAERIEQDAYQLGRRVRDTWLLRLARPLAPLGRRYRLF